MDSPENLLVGQVGMDGGSRYAIMVGVRVDDPDLVAQRLTDSGEGRVIEALRQLAYEIRIAFSSKEKLASIGDDWRYAFLLQIVSHTTSLHKQRPPGYPLIAHLPEGLPVEYEWLGAYLTNASAGLVQVRTKVVREGDRILALPQLVARMFHDALQGDVFRPSTARDRYDALAPLVTHIEDLGLNVSYCQQGTSASTLVREVLSS